MKYTVSLAFLTITLLYSILVNILFHGKKHIKTKETQLFGSMAITNLIGILLEIGCIVSLTILGKKSFISLVINKAFLIYFLVILMIFSMYVVHISEIQDEENIKTKLLEIIKIGIQTLFLISTLLVCLLPTYVFIEGDITYSYGASVNVVYYMSFLCSLGCIVYLASIRNNIKNKRNIPIIAFVLLMGIACLIQKNFPQITLATSVETLIIFLMFHTIENPDLKLIQELQVAREHADKANRSKTDFLSNMSHEIRTPLNAIVGFSDCILDAKQLEEAKENAKDIVSASQTLLEIVNGILDISKIESGKLDIITTKYNAHKTFTELAKLISTRMKEKGLDFSYYIAPDVPETLYGDQANIRKIITNLLSNACKYTDKGFVRYEVNCVNMNDYTRLIISVEDSGRGIRKESIDKMFTKFQRLDEDKNTTIEGTGLGLAITKQLTELMGGKVIVHTIYGEGSKFTIVLNQRIAETEVTAEVENYNASLDLKDIKILVVDDAPLNLKVAKKVLEKFNANKIDTCESGNDCIQKIADGNQYDVILLDDMMPKMSGVKTLQILRENRNFKTPVVALTANALSGMREKYLKDGFTDFLAKPIEKEELIRIMNEILGKEDNILKPQEMKQEEKTIIIPVEENIEELLGEKVNLTYKEELEKKESTKVVEKKILPVVDILEEDPSSEENNIEYLEENGVDVKGALDFLGDIEMYNMTIKDYQEEMNEKWNKILTYYKNKDMDNYSIEVHSLKSNSKYLGFIKLADIAYLHEIKSKENDISFIEKDFKDFEQEYNRIKELVDHYISKLKG